MAHKSQASTTPFPPDASGIANYVRLRAEKFLAGDESGAAVGRHCSGPQVSSLNLRADGWSSPMFHPIGVALSNAGLVIIPCLRVAAHYHAFLSFSPCATSMHLCSSGQPHCGYFFLSSSPEELTCARRLSLKTGSTLGNLTPLPASVRLGTLWRSCRPPPRLLSNPDKKG